MATDETKSDKLRRETTKGDAGSPDRTIMIDVPGELGSYRLTRVLGRGGMGEVWLAFDKHLERDVAIKLMRKELLSNEDATRRFAREARAVARLNHPNIVQVYAFGDEKGILYFVMELVEGETVAQRLKRERTLPLDASIGIMMQAIEGLGYACERGIIHRDIKPSNLMLTPDGRVKIADFGLAKMVEHDTQMTAAGTAMGSPNYMSPEQARGEEADHRSDIYALGISLYQMLCGGLPFTANSPVSVLLKHIQEPLPEPEDLRCLGQGAALNLIKKMTAKNPAGRFQTYAELAAALAALQPDKKFGGAHSATASMPATSGGATAAATTAAAPTLNSTSYEPASADAITVDGPVHTPSNPPVQPPAPPPPPVPPTPHAAAPRKSEDHNPKTLILAAIALIVLCVAGVVVGLMLIPDFDKLNSPEVAAPQPQAQANPADTTVEQGNPAVSSPNIAGNNRVQATPESAPPPSPAPTTPLPATPPPTQVPATAASSALPPAAASSTAPPVNAPPAPTSSPANSASASPKPNGIMQPVNITAMVGSPTPYPGVVTSPTPRPNLADLLPSGITLPNQRPPDMASASQAQIYTLGTAGSAPGEMVPAYRDKEAKILYKRYPAGTQVTVIGTTAVMFHVMTPDQQALYVYKKMAQKK